MNILIRADSSSHIGTGHIMRDLVLAKRFKDSTIIFATRNLAGNINHKIEEAGYYIEPLKSNDLEELDNLIRCRKIDMIVIDNYDIDCAFETQLKQKNPDLIIMVLDDTYEKHNCDILLNHNFCADESKYKDLVPEHCELQCGRKYTLLREEFILEKERVRERISNKVIVFIAMGGADHSNLNVKILEVLSEFKDKIKAIVVTTSANKYLNELIEYSNNKEWIDLQINSDRIAYLMNISDFAIVTPSVTINEVMFMELPFFAIKTAENQEYAFSSLKNYRCFFLDKLEENKLSNMIKFYIDALSVKLINYTNLSELESKMVLDWRNNKAIRKWMFNTDEISLSEHQHFMSKIKHNENHKYWLVNLDKKNIGSINLKNINDSAVEMGIFVNPSLRGYGQLLIEVICFLSFIKYRKNKIISEVFKKNEKAINLYVKNNFNLVKEKGFAGKKLLQLELSYEDWKEKYVS